MGPKGPGPGTGGELKGICKGGTISEPLRWFTNCGGGGGGGTCCIAGCGETGERWWGGGTPFGV